MVSAEQLAHDFQTPVQRFSAHRHRAHQRHAGAPPVDPKGPLREFKRLAQGDPPAQLEAGLFGARVLPLLGAYLLANVLMYALHAAVTARAFRASQSLARSTTARLRSAVVDQLQCVQLSVVARKGAGALANQLTVDLGRVEGFVALCAARELEGARHAQRVVTRHARVQAQHPRAARFDGERRALFA